jgi:hypothetical protein
MTISLTNKTVHLPLLSIEAAEELQKLQLKMPTQLEHAKELCQLIKKDFTGRLDYSIIFSNAYFATYSFEMPSTLDKRIPYIEGISKKLDSPSTLEDKELKSLIDFCVNLSDYSAMHEEDLESLRGPCFR